MAVQKHSPLINIIIRYHQPLERLARRIVLHKHRAPDIVKWAMEAVYEDGLFYQGPHLRALLIEQTKNMALGFNKAVYIHTQISSGHKAFSRVAPATFTKPSISI